MAPKVKAKERVARTGRALMLSTRQCLSHSGSDPRRGGGQREYASIRRNMGRALEKKTDLVSTTMTLRRSSSPKRRINSELPKEMMVLRVRVKAKTTPKGRARKEKMAMVEAREKVSGKAREKRIPRCRRIPL